MELRAETSVFDDKLLKEDINNAQETADNAQVIAGTTAQYFWFLEEIGSVPAGVGTGAHITNLTKEEFLSNPANGGGNLLARSNGIAIRDGLTELAYFSGTGAQIGKSNGYNSYFDAQSFQIRNGSTLLSKFTSNGVDIYLANDSINSVASFGTTARVGKTSAGYVSIGTSSIDLYKGSTHLGQFSEYTSGTGQLTIYGANNGGLHLYPALLELYGSDTFDNAWYTSSYIRFGKSSSNIQINAVGANDTFSALLINSNGVSNFYLSVTGRINASNYMSTSNGLYITTNNKAIYCKDTHSDDIDVLRLDSTNTLAIGYGLWNKNTSGYDTYVEGYNVYLRARNKCYSNGSQIATSDKRLKKDIVPISDKFKQLFMDLQPVEYRMEQSEDKDIHLGLTAQDVEMAFMKNNIAVDKYAIVDEYSYPEEKTRYKALAYTEFIPLCIKMIQSQQKEIDTLKGEINALHSN